MPKQKVKIELNYYQYQCGDGCCTNYGTITKVNGVPLESHNEDAETIVEQILKHLGYDVEVVSMSNGEEI